MRRLLTIYTPAKASTVAAILSDLSERWGDRLYIVNRANGITVYTDSDGYNGLVPYNSVRRQLR